MNTCRSFVKTEIGCGIILGSTFVIAVLDGMTVPEIQTDGGIFSAIGYALPYTFFGGGILCGIYIGIKRLRTRRKKQQSKTNKNV